MRWSLSSRPLEQKKIDTTDTMTCRHRRDIVTYIVKMENQLHDNKETMTCGELKKGIII